MSISKKLFVCFLMAVVQLAISQEKNEFQIHSHNDYQQEFPFWSAFSNGLNSIEVDVFLKNDTLYATHGEYEIIKNRTIESLYLQPIQKVLSIELGSQPKLQLLIDIKSEAHSSLKKLVSVLERYPDIINNEDISIVISGNRPDLSEYGNYPDYILFDYQSLENIEDAKVWDKVALISLNFKKTSVWNGKGRLTAKDYEKVNSVIQKAHGYGKPFRFWGAPDSKTAWKAFRDLGVDFINTDMPSRAATYLKTLEQRIYHNKNISKVYTPTFVSDQKNIPIQNVILLIGDGNGLTQISSSTLANGGRLSLTQLKSIGLLKTQSADDFTTDSAAAGTALATGEKTNNRAIGVDTSKKPLLNITELLSEHGFLSGCITTDKMTGATPASFYAHQKDRSDIKEIAEVGYFMSETDVPSVLKGRGNMLSEATRNGLQFFQNKNKPFFLMVEGAQIDSNGHLNNVSGIVSEGIDFDKAITEAIKFADKTGNTLVIVTADHETSGFSIPQGNLENNMIEGDFTTHDHTGTMIPIFAYGPHSQEFQGVYENSELFGKILKVLSISAH